MPRKTIIRSRARGEQHHPRRASRMSTCDSAVVVPRAVVVVDAERDRADGAEQDDDVHHPAEVVHGDRAVGGADAAPVHRRARRRSSVTTAEPIDSDADRALVRGDSRRQTAHEQQEHRAAHEDEVGHQRRDEVRAGSARSKVEHHQRPSAARGRRRPRDARLDRGARTARRRPPCGAGPAPDRRRAR